MWQYTTQIRAKNRALRIISLNLFQTKQTIFKKKKGINRDSPEMSIDPIPKNYIVGFRDAPAFNSFSRTNPFQTLYQNVTYFDTSFVGRMFFEDEFIYWNFAYHF